MSNVKWFSIVEDGAVTFEEYIIYVHHMHDMCKSESVTEQELIDAFKKLDKNGDGTITASELVYAMTHVGDKMSIDDAKEMVEMADINADGVINYEGRWVF